MHRHSNKFRTALFSILAIFAVFAIIEITCRSLKLTQRFDADFKFYIRKVDNDLRAPYNIEDALLMWSPKPNYVVGGIKINSQGFRDKEYKIRKPKNTFRILCLGDSSTFWGSYHSLLEEKLNKSSESQDIQFEVISAGVTGYTSYQGLYMYKYKGARYYPDIVTFYFGINDPKKRLYLSDKEILQDKVPYAVKVVKNRLLSKLHFYRLLRVFINNTFKNNNKSSRANVERVSLNDFRENIVELNRLCKGNGSLLIIISPPLCKEIVSGIPGRTADIIRYRKELENIVSEHNIPFIEIKEMTERSENPTIDYFDDAVHPSKLGHELIMQKLYDYLVDHDLLKNSE